MWILGHEGLSMKAITKISSYRKSSIKPHLSNKPPPSNKPLPPFQGKKVNKPPFLVKFLWLYFLFVSHENSRGGGGGGTRALDLSDNPKNVTPLLS